MGGPSLHVCLQEAPPLGVSGQDPPPEATGPMAGHDARHTSSAPSKLPSPHARTVSPDLMPSGQEIVEQEKPCAMLLQLPAPSVGVGTARQALGARQTRLDQTLSAQVLVVEPELGTPKSQACVHVAPLTVMTHDPSP
jgi:hypothetical protein